MNKNISPNVQISKEEFAMMVKDSLVEQYADTGYEFDIKEVNKENDLTLLGITVTSKESIISPCVYVERAYDDYLKNRCCLYQIVDDLSGFIMKQLNSLPTINAEELITREYIKDNIIPTLINTEANAELLQNLVSKQYSDLSVIYRINVTNDVMGSGTIKVSPQILERAGISIDELDKMAMANLKKKEGFNVKSLEYMLGKILGGSSVDEAMNLPAVELSEIKSADSPMYVVVNNSGVFDSNVLLQEEELKRIAAVVEEDYVIIPSSVHEVLLVLGQTENIEELNSMVREVNETQVSREDRLSDHVYVFSLKEGKLLTDTEYLQLGIDERLTRGID